jgi:hypothetical protein
MKRSIKDLEKQFKTISTWMLEMEIARLEENLKTIKSSGTTIVDLKVYVRIRDFYNGLVAVVRKRKYGRSMPEETDDSTD